LTVEERFTVLTKQVEHLNFQIQNLSAHLGCATATLPATQHVVEPNVTLDDLRELFAKASRAGHKDALKATLELHNAQVLPDLDPVDYPKLAEYVQGLLDAS